MIAQAPEAGRRTWVRLLSLEQAGALPVLTGCDAIGRRALPPTAAPDGAHLPGGIYFIRP